MLHILEELYYGNINPSAKQFIRNTSFDKAVRTISESEFKLTELPKKFLLNYSFIMLKAPCKLRSKKPT